MEKFIRGKAPVLHKIAFEMRYRYGYTYLDRCGKTLNAIMREAPEWVLKGEQVNPQGASLVSIDNQCSFNFSSHRMDFGIEQAMGGEIGEQEIESFVEQVDLVSAIVIDQLNLSKFTRIGMRLWYLFRCKDKPESEKWLASLGMFTVSDSLKTAFGGEIEATGFSVVIVGSDRKFRIAFNGVEQSSLIDLGSELMLVRASGLNSDQGKILGQSATRSKRVHVPPQFAAMVDIDAYQEDPISVEPRDFILTSRSNPMERLFSALPPLA
jgi:hypothetical protein